MDAGASTSLLVVFEEREIILEESQVLIDAAFMRPAHIVFDFPYDLLANVLQ